MAKIVFLAANEETFRAVQILSEEMNFPVEIILSSGSERIKLVEKLVGHADVIIGRWGNDLPDIEKRFRVAFVNVPFTAYDFVRVLHQAWLKKKPTGIVHYRTVVRGLMTVAQYLPVKIVEAAQIQSPSAGEMQSVLEVNRSKGVRLVITNVEGCKLSAELGLDSLHVKAGPESITQALNEARQIIPSQMRERERAERFKAILDFAHDGIIAVDSDAKITVFNNKAEEILGFPRSSAIGREIAAILKQSDLPEILQSGIPTQDVVQLVGGKCIVSNNIPIMINGLVKGAVQTFIEASRLQETEGKLRRKLSEKGLVAKFTFNDIVGRSEAIRAVIRRSKRYSEVDSSILVYGETGTGKEIFAQSIHSASRRARGPFVAVNCAALPESLLESELFGYVEGAFTGARREGKAGLFELAHGGTVFLDEVSELPVQIQGRFLRVLQERELSRIGDDRVIPIDVRIIAATNRDLPALVEEKKFRQDLYFRLNVLSLNIPPLQDRPEDIPDLLEYFLGRASIANGRPVYKIPPSLMSWFMSWKWPGNVRELANVCERMVVMTDKNGYLPEEEIRALFPRQTSTGKSEVNLLHDLESLTISRVLQEVNGNKNLAAKMLGISPTTLWRRLKAMDL